MTFDPNGWSALVQGMPQLGLESMRGQQNAFLQLQNAQYRSPLRFNPEFECKLHPDRVYALAKEAERWGQPPSRSKPSIRVRFYMVVFWLYRKLFGHAWNQNPIPDA